MAGASPLEVTCRFSQEGEVQPADWRLLIEFNRPVSVLELSKKVKYLAASATSMFTVINATDTTGAPAPQPLPGERTKFVLGPKTSAKSGSGCVITIAPGLSAPGGEPLMAPVQVAFEARETIDVLEVEPFYNGDEGRGISVKVSDAIETSALKRKLRILPPIGRIRVKKTDDETAHIYHVTGALETGKSYQAEIRGGDIDGYDFIFTPRTVPFIAKGPGAALRFEADRSVIELHSRQMVPVSVTNLSGVRCQLTRIPPMFAPEFTDLTTLAADDARRPRTSSGMHASDDIETAIASAAVFAEQKMVEGVKRLEEIQTLPAPSGNTNLTWFTGDFAQSAEPFFANGAPDKTARLSLPLTFRKDSTKGGAYLVQLLDPERPEMKHATRLFQITDLSVTYKFSATQLLIWITSMETGKPLPDTAVMLFTRDDKRLFVGLTGRSDAAGVEQL
ncbi:MAG TPA: hypothetical protein PKM25_18665, partial [Candidatus Ozemobacteraceae bacterium]|nr:hypothetical protein [Candidatus Ozemobacteraceae bacterium]